MVPLLGILYLQAPARAEYERKEHHVMNMTPVSSSNISSIGYEGTTLYVRFNSGALYAYYDVPQSIYSGLMSASSHGKYLAAYIKGSYRYQQIG